MQRKEAEEARARKKQAFLRWVLTQPQGSLAITGAAQQTQDAACINGSCADQLLDLRISAGVLRRPSVVTQHSVLKP